MQNDYMLNNTTPYRAYSNATVRVPYNIPNTELYSNCSTPVIASDFSYSNCITPNILAKEEQGFFTETIPVNTREDLVFSTDPTKVQWGNESVKLPIKTPTILLENKSPSSSTGPAINPNKKYHYLRSIMLSCLLQKKLLMHIQSS